jgi:electron transfer flavoprotein alpha subunit
MSPFQVKRSAFSNKAFNITEIETETKVLALSKNSFGIIENQRSSLSEENFEPTLSDADFNIK